MLNYFFFMANSDAVEFFKELKRVDSDNNTCFECASPNPQWASECSGRHRSLGVHLRSLAMDSWSEKQLEYMKVGGNKRARIWFAKYGISNLDFFSKYNSPQAESYRQKLKNLVQKIEFKDPDVDYFNNFTTKSSCMNLNYSQDFDSKSQNIEPSTMKKKSYSSISSRNEGYHPNSNSNYSDSGNIRTYDSFGNNSSSSGDSSGSGIKDNRNIYKYSDQDRAIMSSNYRERMRNQPSSFSNKINGTFGECPQLNNDFPDEDDPFNSIYDGWSKISSGIKNIANTALENVSNQNFEVSQWASKIAESQTWGYLTSFFKDDSDKNQRSNNYNTFESKTFNNSNNHNRNSFHNNADDKGLYENKDSYRDKGYKRETTYNFGYENDNNGNNRDYKPLDRNNYSSSRKVLEDEDSFW